MIRNKKRKESSAKWSIQRIMAALRPRMIFTVASNLMLIRVLSMIFRSRLVVFLSL